MHVANTQILKFLNQFPAAVYLCDPEGLITYFNDRAQTVWGRSPKLNDPQDRYCGSYKLYTPEGNSVPHDSCWMALALQQKRDFVGRNIVVERENGERSSVLAHANPIWDSEGKMVGGINVLVDVTGRLSAESMARAMMPELDVATSLSAERYRIGREIHDGVGQDLTALSFMLRLLKTEMETQATSPQLTWLAEMEQSLSAALTRVRELTRSLLPQ